MRKDNLSSEDLEGRFIGLFTEALESGSTFRRFTHFEVGPGWMPIVADMLTEMSLNGSDPFLECIQLGEGGGLEVIHYRSDDRIEAAVGRAQRRADCTCGECGGRRDMKVGEYDWAVGLCRRCLADLRARDSRRH